MPLMKTKSKQAFGKNVATEMDSGKPQKQALAIAYNTMRAAGPKVKKMAKGGSVNPSLQQSHEEPCEHGGPMHCAEGCYAEGGEAMPTTQKATSMSLADAVMSKRKKMADGGQVGDDDMEPGNNFEELSEEAYKKELYDGDDISPQPEDSNEKGDEDERPRGTLVARIMSKRKKSF